MLTEIESIWVCDKFVGETLAGPSRFPEIFPQVAEVHTAQGQDGIGATSRPMHARLFEPLAYDGFAAGFHYPGADEQTALSELAVAHALGVGLEVVNLPLNGGLHVWLGRLEPHQRTQEQLDFPLIKFPVSGFGPRFPL
jgi:hypothetical protein